MDRWSTLTTSAVQRHIYTEIRRMRSVRHLLKRKAEWWWCRASCPRLSVDILGTNCYPSLSGTFRRKAVVNQCLEFDCDQYLSMVQCCFTSTETVRLIRTPGKPRTQTPSIGLRHPSLQEGAAGKRCSECAQDGHLDFHTAPMESGMLNWRF